MSSASIQWFDSLDSRGIKPGLDAIRSLLAELGDPHIGPRIIHVAGSDGKGSVCAMLESVLLAAGRRVGMFTSPHVLKVNESIRIDGMDIGDSEFEECMGIVMEAAKRIGSGCTSFEALTACAFVSFKRSNVEFAIVEVGLGGRLDATNVVSPEVTVINNISMEHTAFLGNTIRGIAGEKAGIMKPGVPCVTINSGESLEVLISHSEEVGCPLSVICKDDVQLLNETPDSIMMRYDCRNFEIGLSGSYQRFNAALALEALGCLKDSSSILPFAHIGLHSVEWPYRMQRLDGLPIIIDATHTKTGAEYLEEDIRRIYGKVILVTGMLSDKDLDGVAERLSRIASEVHVSSPDSPRAADKELLASHYRKYHEDVTVHGTVGEALDSVIGKGDTVLVTGSFRTVEDCLRWLRRTR